MTYKVLKITTKDDVIVPAVSRTYESVQEAITKEMEDALVESITLEDEDGYRQSVIRDIKKDE